MRATQLKPEIGRGEKESLLFLLFQLLISLLCDSGNGGDGGVNSFFYIVSRARLFFCFSPDPRKCVCECRVKINVTRQWKKQMLLKERATCRL